MFPSGMLSKIQAIKDLPIKSLIRIVYLQLLFWRAQNGREEHHPIIF